MIAIDTERLAVRNFKVSDWKALDEIIAQYESSEPEEIIRITEWFAGGDSLLAVCLKAMSQLIGFVALTPY